MNGINDTPALARQLAGLLKGVLCHVNLIPLNPVAESPYQPSSPVNGPAFCPHACQSDFYCHPDSQNLLKKLICDDPSRSNDLSIILLLCLKG
jgi:hypothetical protein